MAVFVFTIVSVLQFRVFPAAAVGFFNRILGLVLGHFGVDDFVRVQTKFVQHVNAVDDDVGKLFLDIFKLVVVLVPLEAFQQFVGLDGDGFGKICRRMELVPKTLSESRFCAMLSL